MELLFDTNIFIYHFNGQLNAPGTDLLSQGLQGFGAYSIISKIELLGFEQSETAEMQARQLLSRLIELPLTTEVAESTVILRQRYRIKIPDAIIAATALEHSLALVTRNQSDFAKIDGLNLTNPFT